MNRQSRDPRFYDQMTMLEIIAFHLGNEEYEKIKPELDKIGTPEGLKQLAYRDWKDMGVTKRKIEALIKKLNEGMDAYEGAPPKQVFESFFKSPTALKANFISKLLGTEMCVVPQYEEVDRINEAATRKLMEDIAQAQGAWSGDKLTYFFDGQIHQIRNINTFVGEKGEMVDADIDGNVIAPDGRCAATQTNWSIVPEAVRRTILQILFFAKATGELVQLPVEKMPRSVNENTKLPAHVHRSLAEFASRENALADLDSLCPVAAFQYTEARINGKLPKLQVEKPKLVLDLTSDQ